jgi:hypothetical protein
MSRHDQAPDPRRPATEAAERLAVIVDAAERAALSVIDDAEREARRYLAEAQERADKIIAERLRETADLLERQHASAVPERRLRPVEVEPAAADEEEAEAPARNPGSAAARLLATQMAVSGNSRREIAARLRNGFEIEDADEILDAILGPEE